MFLVLKKKIMKQLNYGIGGVRDYFLRIKFSL